MNLFDLQAKLTLDSSGFESGLDKAKSLVSNISSGIGTAMKVGAAAIGAATTAVSAFGAAAVKSYAEYEQLSGGVEKLYGDAADKLMEFANKAYATSGMNVNDYMETATSFSAALINALGGDVFTAANMTDVAMRAMSDNVNTFGSSMESVQNAFKGFSKGQFNMLDNLKLGYGGTKEEMERLLRDAEEYEGYIAGSLSIDSFADIIDAIQIVQEHLNVAGTTAKEAMTTIEGSANATKAAWQNVVTAIGRGEGLSEALEGLTTSFFGGENGGGLLNNIIPRIKTTMEGIGEFIGQAGPLLADKIPALIDAVLPSMLSAGMSLIGALASGFSQALPTVLDTIGNIVEQVLTSLVDATKKQDSFILNALQYISTAISDNLDMFLDLGGQLFNNIFGALSNPERIGEIMVEMGYTFKTIATAISSNLPTILSAVTSLITNVSSLALETITWIMPDIISALVDGFLALTNPDNINRVLQAGLDLVVGLADGLLQAVPVIVEALPTLINNIIDVLLGSIPMLIEAGISLFSALVDNLPAIIDAIVLAIPSIIVGITTGILSHLPEIIEAGFSLFIALIENLPTIIVEIVKAIPEIIKGIVDGFKEHWEDIKEAGKQILTKVKDGFEAVKDKVTGVVDTVKTALSSKFDAIKENAQTKFTAMKDNIGNIFDNIKDKVTTVWQNILDIPIVQAIADWVTNTFNNLKETLSGIWDGIKDYAQGAWELIKTVILAPVLILIDLITGDTEKLQEDLINIWNKIKESGEKIWEGLKKIVTSLVTGLINQVKNNFKLFADALKAIWDGIKNKAVEIWTNIKNKVVETATNLVNGVKEWINKIPGIIKEKFTEAMDFIKNLPSQALQWGKDLIDNFVQGIKDTVGKIGDAISGVAGTIRDFLGFSEPKKGPLSNFHTFAPDMIDLFIKGIEDNEKRLTNAVAGAFDFENLIAAPTMSTNGGNVDNVVGRGNNYYTINVNQPISTPADMLREIRTEAQYGLMIGEALA